MKDLNLFTADFPSNSHYFQNKTIMKKYTIKEFAEGKKAVKIENEEQWNKLNKTYRGCSPYFKTSCYYLNNGLNSNSLVYLQEQGWEVLEFSQLDFEDEQLFKIGDQFKTDDDHTVYTFSNRTGNTVFITWGTNGKTDYSLETCNKFLERGDWVLIKKEENMEQIIGYKLVKLEYKEAALKIANLVDWGVSFRDKTVDAYNPQTIAKLKKAGVLDLWFEPVYAPKYSLPKINGKQCVDNGNKTITCGCTTKSFDWILGVEYAMGEEIDISGTKVSDKEIKQIVEYINNKS
jgi:hypothetical protein